MACKSQRANKPAWASQCKMPKDSDASLRAIGPRHLNTVLFMPKVVRNFQLLTTAVNLGAKAT